MHRHIISGEEILFIIGIGRDGAAMLAAIVGI
jgi:hypothetical protein